MTRWYRFLQTWHQFWAILYTFNRHTELGRLMVWADRKQLRGPLRSYVQHRQREEERLAYYATRFPQLMKHARRLHAVGNLISPAPRFSAKGSAASYRNQRFQAAAHS